MTNKHENGNTVKQLTANQLFDCVAVRRKNEIDGKDPDTLFEIKEYDYFSYVLTDELAPWQAHKQYGQRATSETWIEEANNQSALAHIKTADFWANSALFQAAILTYNTLRWMALCSGNKILQRWETATIRTFLIQMAGKWTTGSRQQKLRVPKRMLYNAQWEAWVAVAETQLFIEAYDRKFDKRGDKIKGELRPKFRSKHTKGYQQS